ncbi:MAG TPA: transcription termination/antitermination protein NusA [Polyangiaceae bacterium]|nr:transcription termination/antitermination protein NusA [Polyangiaceae bacterium]
MARSRAKAKAPEVNLNQVLEEVAKEKGIEKSALIETIEAAILKAAQNTFGPGRDLEARYNPEKGHVELYQFMTVVEEVEDEEREIAMKDLVARNLQDEFEAEIGEEIGFQVFWREEDKKEAEKQDKSFGDLLGISQSRQTFGRIAAQTAKQVLLQRVRDAERDIIFEEYKHKKGELIRGIVRRFERGNNIIVDLGRTEAILPSREQTPRESYRPGERIVAYVKDVDREARGPIVILSRSDPRLVDKLFEAEVPEIYEGIVRIVAVAREAGSRSKIAVTSRDADVDPVGACVGMKGSRVQAVVQELRGEKIDIVPYDRDPARYVIAAIQPAEVSKVIVDEAGGRMEIVVPDEKLSLAIGRKGQNVRLASQLTDWKLDVISESKFKKMEEEAVEALQQIDIVSDAVAKAMYRVGFRALEEVAEASVEELAGIQGIDDPAVAEKIRDSAFSTMERIRDERLNAIATRDEPPTERERLLCVHGLGVRTLTLLEDGGYKTLASVVKEDADRLGIKTGIGLKKAAAIKKAAQEFAAKESELYAQARARLQASGALSSAGESEPSTETADASVEVRAE